MEFHSVLTVSQTRGGLPLTLRLVFLNIHREALAAIRLQEAASRFDWNILICDICGMLDSQHARFEFIANIR